MGKEIVPDEEPKPKGFEALGLLAAVVLTAVVDGFIVSRMWQWFIVPLGVPPIGIAQAVGLDVLWKAISPSRWGDPTTRRTTTQNLVSWFYRVLIVISIGYVAHVMM